MCHPICGNHILNGWIKDWSVTKCLILEHKIVQAYSHITFVEEKKKQNFFMHFVKFLYENAFLISFFYIKCDLQKQFAFFGFQFPSIFINLWNSVENNFPHVFKATTDIRWIIPTKELSNTWKIAELRGKEYKKEKNVIKILFNC